MSHLVLHVTGARPNFPKAAPVIRALADLGASQELIHTGQHYDDRMSDVFFRQLGLPKPDVDLGVGSDTHARQTAAIMTGLEELFGVRRPALVVVYGDVNSTLAAALVTAKMRIPLAHVEAGLRSFDMTMPEEVNRLVTDRLSDLLFATSADALAHLGNEGIAAAKIHLVGNPMIDTLLANLDRFDVAKARADHRITDRYIVATLHRPSNVDNPADAAELVAAVHAVAEQCDVILPLHPRGRAGLEAAGLFAIPRLRVIDPLGYVEFLGLVRGAEAVITDSGGVQEETTILGVPCLTLRPNTERPVTITHGTNQLVTRERLPNAVADCLAAGRADSWPVPPLWDGKAGLRIASVIASALGSAEREVPGHHRRAGVGAASAGAGGAAASQQLNGHSDHSSGSAPASQRRKREPMLGFGMPSGVATVTWAIETQRKVVALTFDDGPMPNYTPMVLDALDAADVPATFFLVGRRLEQNAAIVEGRMDRHEIGNHTYSHKDLSALDFDAAYDEIKRAHDSITKIIGRAPRLLRPPFGHISTLALRAADRFSYDVVLWSHGVSERHFQADPYKVVSHVADNITPGSIFLAHDAGAPNVEPVFLQRIGTIVAAMRDKGYEFMTVSDLLALREPGLGLVS
jgi:UDP-N-acetylglucosamine 2-epimerase (non-hydrolysing)